MTTQPTTTYFAAYLNHQHENWISDDATLIRLLDRFADKDAPTIKERLHRLAEEVAGDFRLLADEAARPENLPYLRHFDAYHRRIDDVVLPSQTRELMRRTYLKRPFRRDLNPWEAYAMLYLFSQNGEAGVMCSTACTDGMVRLLRRFANTPELKTILDHLENGREGEFYHAAQFVTEIQGGSDAATNTLDARPDGNTYRLYGNKWFCSNITADYFAVTARPSGAPAGPKGVALFAVPAYLPGTRERNGYRIDRLKNKLGTQSLPTTELTFDGAIAYPVGPLDKGLSNMVGIVLTTSRLHAALTNIAFLRRACREARRYAEFRDAFGQKIASFPLVNHELQDLDALTNRLLAGTFALFNRELEIETLRNQNTDTATLALKKYVLRILIMMNKVVATREASLGIHRVISIFAGNGIEEEWSPVPRLFRDAVINEVWEGPHHLLTTRALLDLEAAPISAKQFIDEALSHISENNRSFSCRELETILEIRDQTDKFVAFAAWMNAFMATYARQFE